MYENSSFSGFYKICKEKREFIKGYGWRWNIFPPKKLNSSVLTNNNRILSGDREWGGKVGGRGGDGKGGDGGRERRGEGGREWEHRLIHYANF